VFAGSFKRIFFKKPEDRNTEKENDHPAECHNPIAPKFSLTVEREDSGENPASPEAAAPFSSNQQLKGIDPATPSAPDRTNSGGFSVNGSGDSQQQQQQLQQQESDRVSWALTDIMQQE
jgi:hypothetical protein